MTSILQRRWVFAAALIGAGLVLTSAALAGSVHKRPTNAGVLPLVLEGRQLPALAGASLLGLTAFSCSAQKISPILFQVDEVNPDNIVVSGDSLPKVRADERPGLIDDNDQIVFLQRDLGVQCNDEQLARARGKLIEIEVTGNALNQTAYLYLLSAERGHVPSNTAVRYNKASQTISTAAYEMSFEPGVPHMMRSLILRELRGRHGTNVLDRLKVRMDAAALGSLVNLSIDEEDVSGAQVSARVGPIRVVRELQLDVRPVPGFKIPATVRFVNYERFFHAEVGFTIPKAAALVVSGLDLYLAMDYLDLRGIRISTSGLPQGAVVDGRTAAMEKNFDLGPKRWYLLTGEGINHVSVLHMEKGLNLQPTARFSDGEGEAFAWPPERVPGGLPQIGYGLMGWQDLEARGYQFAVDIGMLPSFPDGGGDGFTDSVNAAYAIRASERTGDAADEAR